MEVECLSCFTKFEGRLQTEVLEGVKILFIECPDCQTRYVSYVVDQEVEKGFAKAKNLLKRMGSKNLSYHKRQEARRKHDRVTAENRRLMIEKKAKYAHLIEQVISNAN